MVAAPDDDTPADDDPADAGEGAPAVDDEAAPPEPEATQADEEEPADDTSPDPSAAPSASRPLFADYLGTGPERTVRLVLGVTVLALVARLVLLGDRVQHFDEARVAWWTLEFMRTGEFRYRYIIHGPFIQHLNTWLFALLGTSDFATRVVPAVVGGLLPATALLFREHLRRTELVALALFLSFDPLLLYYSRFSRSTILVAGFAFVAFGLFVRAYDAVGETDGAAAGRAVATDGGGEASGASRASSERRSDGGAPAEATGRPATTTRLFDVLGLGTTRPAALYVHAGVFFLALAFAAKENAIVYVLCWLGAGALVADRLLSTPGENGFDRVEALLERLVLNTGYYLGHALVAAVILVVVTLFFYAPRGAAAPDGVGLYAALGDPTALPTLVDSTYTSIETGLDYWFGGSAEPGCNKDNLIDGYLCYLGQFAESLALYAAPLAALSVVGFVAERYASGRPRGLVMFAGFWGFASVFGYPLGTDIYGSWITVNALVPLAIPAAIGLALLFRWGVEAYREDDGISLVLVMVLLLLSAGFVGVQGVNGVYVQPEEGPDSLVQYAQPAGDWRPIIEELNAIAPANEGDDVLFHGSYYVDGDGSAVRTPACVKWFKALSLPWYTEKADMQVACTNSTADLDARESMPPVVISRASNQDALEERLGDDYEKRVTFIRRDAIRTVVYIDQGAPRAALPAASTGDPRGERADRERVRSLAVDQGA
jgi:uncharacterized protein (TIGR03663 family)